jgi:glutathione synthase/RimK-type ligase-like ATP-grasp enzyme
VSNKVNKIFLGSICNRDIEIFDQIKKFCNKNYNISIVNLVKKGSNTFNQKYYMKQLKKYPISSIIVKLFSEESNQQIYQTIKELTPNISQINSIDAVKTCESRKKTFELIKQKCKKLTIPRSYDTHNQALKACHNGTKIIIKLDKHNIPNLAKEKRILGIARTPRQFINYVQDYHERDLFFQEYLGKLEVVYKVYVIGRWVVSITSHNRLKQREILSPLDLIHIRTPIEKQLKRRLLRLGRKMGMSLYGIDYVLSKEGVPYIVDVNDFPSFRSIPEAISLISDHIYNNLLLQKQVIKSAVKIGL